VRARIQIPLEHDDLRAGLAEVGAEGASGGAAADDADIKIGLLVIHDFLSTGLVWFSA
jgi:hypothetical protein